MAAETPIIQINHGNTERERGKGDLTKNSEKKEEREEREREERESTQISNSQPVPITEENN